MNNGKLYIVGTPIGNLEDITKRAERILKEVDLVLCEDTRVTKKLLSHLKISAKTESFHQHSDGRKLQNIISLLKSGKNIAFVSDAGTPGVSDPGSLLVSEAYKEDIQVEAIPGASAVTTALSVSGFSADKFTFLGFPPHKKGREKFFEELSQISHTIVIFESKHRILKTIDQLPSDRYISLHREITKIYDTTIRGYSDIIKKELETSSIKGEFVLVIAPKKWKI